MCGLEILAISCSQILNYCNSLTWDTLWQYKPGENIYFPYLYRNATTAFKWALSLNKNALNILKLMYKDRNLNIYFKVLFQRLFAFKVLIPLHSRHSCFSLVLFFSPSFSFQVTEEYFSPTHGKCISNYNVPPQVANKTAESLSYDDLLRGFYWDVESAQCGLFPINVLSIYIILQLTLSYACHFYNHVFNSLQNRHLSCVSYCFSACNDFSKKIARSSKSLLINFLKALTCIFRLSKWLFPWCKTVFNHF